MRLALRLDADFNSLFRGLYRLSRSPTVSSGTFAEVLDAVYTHAGFSLGFLDFGLSCGFHHGGGDSTVRGTCLSMA